MERQQVSSSTIRSIGYDSQSAILEVEFLSSSIYRYFNIPDHLHKSLLIASSKGSFLNNYVKYSYRYVKIK